MIEVVKNNRRKWIELHYNSRADVIEAELEKQGFKWHNNKLCWVIADSEQNMSIAKQYVHIVEERIKLKNKKRTQEQLRHIRVKEQETQYLKDPYSWLAYISETFPKAEEIFCLKKDVHKYESVNPDGISILIEIVYKHVDITILFGEKKHDITNQYLAKSIAKILINGAIDLTGEKKCVYCGKPIADGYTCDDCLKIRYHLWNEA